jgi:hypothetical protein
MRIEALRHFFALCTVINYVILIVWFLAIAFARVPISRLHRRFFDLPVDKFNSINYLGISFYKIGILLFNLVPYLVLWIMAE